MALVSNAAMVRGSTALNSLGHLATLGEIQPNFDGDSHMRKFNKLTLVSISGVFVLSLGCGREMETLDKRQRTKDEPRLEDSFSLGTAKSSSYQGDLAAFDANSGWHTIMSVDQFTPNGHELQMTASLQSSILTETTVRSKLGKKDTSTADAGIYVRFLVDGNPVKIGSSDTIVFNQRVQQLSATLGGIITSCTDANADGTLLVADECDVTDEEISLLISTTSANSFSVVAMNLASGWHRVEVQAQAKTSTTYQSGSARAEALAQIGSLIVNQVRQVK